VINFRYHIVSLMAVFLALSVGIAVGVTLRPSVDVGLIEQAAQDRKQVQELRAELDRRNVLDDYADDWAAQAGAVTLTGVLAGERVALVSMPGAPGPVMDAVAAAVTEAGGTVTRTAVVAERVFDPAQTAEVSEAVQPLTGLLGLTDEMSLPTKVGLALSRSLLAQQTQDRDDQAAQVTRTLTRAGLATIDDDSDAQAQLAVLVTGEAPDSPPTNEQLDAHVDLAVALKASARGEVLAGPNSAGVEGSDVLAVRTDSDAAGTLSTVDVADLASGVATVVLAGKEQLLGRAGHYGALAEADGALPELPVR
jgi:hypothetical protein